MLKKTKLRKNVEFNRIEKTDFEFLKWISLFISIAGIILWMAGISYESGYWFALGEDSTFMSKSIQRTIFNGFIGPSKYWVMNLFALLLCGIFMAILVLAAGWLEKQRKKIKIKRSMNTNFKASSSSYSEWFKMAFLLIIFVMVVLIIILFSFEYILLSYGAGKNLAEKKICTARHTKEFPSTVNLFNGTVLNGEIFDRSEKFSVFIDKKNIYVVSISDKPQIMDFTDTTKIKCELNKE